MASRKQSIFMLKTAAHVCCMYIALGAFSAGAQTLKDTIETFFSDMHVSFAKIAESSAFKKKQSVSTDQFFIRELKKNQVYFSLLRTNAKGMVSNELVRANSPEKTRRTVADQQWFRYVSRNNKQYDGFLKEGERYYLFWAQPLVATAHSGVKRQGGAVAVKIDLWDCFHQLSNATTTPFLIRMAGMSLYSHKWDNKKLYTEQDLNVPGVDKISVRIEKQAIAAPTPDSSQLTSAPAAAAPPTEQPSLASSEKKPETQIHLKSPVPLIILAVVLLIGLIVAGAKIIMWLNDMRIARTIEKSNRFKL
jgi:hypothetical protein